MQNFKLKTFISTKSKYFNISIFVSSRTFVYDFHLSLRNLFNLEITICCAEYS